MVNAAEQLIQPLTPHQLNWLNSIVSGVKCCAAAAAAAAAAATQQHWQPPSFPR
jgi:hypothetical protein